MKCFSGTRKESNRRPQEVGMTVLLTADPGHLGIQGSNSFSTNCHTYSVASQVLATQDTLGTLHDPGYINATTFVYRKRHKPSNVTKTVKKHLNPTRHSLGSNPCH
jgi:hypothetical protein